MLVSLVISTIAFFLFWQNQALRNQIDKLQSSPSPASSASALASAVPAAGWQTYTNAQQNISFQYPASWELTETPGDKVNGQILNQNVTLSKSPSSISMNFNMNGIGGSGMDLEGAPYTLSGINLYKYVRNMENGNVLVGITETLKTSLGVFRANGKTYSISLVYPANSSQNYKSDFDSILSTFKFTAPVSTYTLQEISEACINIRNSSKYWSDKYKECWSPDGSITLKAFCDTYNGTFVENGDTCRHAQAEGIPCGPEAQSYCSF